MCSYAVFGLHLLDNIYAEMLRLKTVPDILSDCVFCIRFACTMRQSVKLERFTIAHQLHKYLAERSASLHFFSTHLLFR